ncbi:hydrogen gas-evolving membrane-bound hydrogenase subunit E [Phycisphaera mikurensis]|uniref:Na(+)/H(+) antiporter subunit A n=1 Tax=Phycisphaera mikurensis (strain NBRC 102666 / KCTC 22515 / FYK2301M01) TaxID=1142394 RepID=I0IC32_PHYMF|nr:hydrogen gas-evolving membrane-bound hydrogenase subunit E [Phycisphaera mikurensis]MBB6441956.1 multicomponent Na+:H+ antiporter subunit A [Phycisphaera mikurensis]BAM02820.1 Na(+)/H(+) antiporter subunit A [Phycisphaera mikurensis NBRC 102666]
MALPLSVISLLALAALAPWLVRAAGWWAGWVAAAVPAGWFAWFAVQVGGVAAGRVLAPEPIPWVETLGISLAWRLDGLGLLFALLVTGVGAAVCVYAGGYMRGHARFGKFMATLLTFMAAMLGLVLADDLVLLFVFWELTSITSFLLIGFYREKEAARSAAMRALIVTGGGGLALLAGVILLGLEAGTFRVSELLEMGPQINSSPRYLAILALIFLGCFTKSAQFPFHFWLPGAMEAPAPVSAYLHSSTMVKAGVFLLARLTPVLGGTPEWSWTLKLVGGFTMVYAAVLAARSTKLKRILAWTTVSALGTMVMLLGLGVPGDAAAVTFLLAHALYKGTLFMVAGVIEHQTGEKDVERLGGLLRKMPVTWAAAVLGALSLAGVPPLFGYTGKYLLKGGLAASPWDTALLVAVTVTGVGMVTAALLVAFRPFAGAGHPIADRTREAGPALLVGPVVLATLGLLAGVAPGLFADPIVLAATDAVTGQPGEAELSSLHLFSPSALAGPTGIALLGGVVLYAFRGGFRRGTGLLDRSKEGPAVFDAALAGVLALGRAQTRLLQHGSLTGYVRTCVVGLLVLGGSLLIGRMGTATLLPEHGAVRPVEAILVGLMIASGVAAAVFRHRLGSIAALGVVGICAALIFLLFGAPDVAMTQFAIETLTVLILVLVFYHLPEFRNYTSRSRKAVDLLLSLAFGAFMTVLVLLAVDTGMGQPVSSYFSEQAVAAGKGRNIVNVIIVDFRATDTFGELFVLALAGMGVATLLIARRERPDAGEAAAAGEGEP